MSVIPEFVWERFGSDKAQPVVVEIYSDPSVGWVRARRRERLTGREIALLRAEGVTLVRARWRLRVEEIPTSQAEEPEIVRRRRSTYIAEERRRAEPRSIARRER